MNKENLGNPEGAAQSTQWDSLSRFEQPSSEERGRLETPKSADFKYVGNDGNEMVDHLKVFSSPQFAEYLATVATGAQTDDARLAQKALGVEVPAGQQNVAEYVQAQLSSRIAQAQEEGRFAFDTRRVTDNLVDIAEKNSQGVTAFDKRNNGSVQGIMKKIEDGFFSKLDEIEQNGGTWSIEIAKPATAAEQVAEAPSASETSESDEAGKKEHLGPEALHAPGSELGENEQWYVDDMRKNLAEGRREHPDTTDDQWRNSMISRLGNYFQIPGHRTEDVEARERAEREKINFFHQAGDNEIIANYVEEDLPKPSEEQQARLEELADMIMAPAPMPEADQQLIRDMREAAKNGYEDGYITGGETAESTVSTAEKEKGFERGAAYEAFAERRAPISVGELDDMDDETVEKLSSMSNEEIAEFMNSSVKSESSAESAETGEMTRDEMIDELVDLEAPLSMDEVEKMSDEQLHQYVEDLRAKKTAENNAEDESDTVEIEPEASLRERLKNFLTKENLKKVFSGIAGKARSILKGIGRKFGFGAEEQIEETADEAEEVAAPVAETVKNTEESGPGKIGEYDVSYDFGEMLNDAGMYEGTMDNPPVTVKVETAPSEKVAETPAEQPAAEEEKPTAESAEIKKDFDSRVENGIAALSNEDFVKTITGKKKLRRLGFNGGMRAFGEMVARVNGERGLPVLEQDKKKLAQIGDLFDAWNATAEQAAEVAASLIPEAEQPATVEETAEAQDQASAEEEKKEPTKRSEYVVGTNPDGSPIYDASAIYASQGFADVLAKHTEGNTTAARTARDLLDYRNRHGVDAMIAMMGQHDLYKGPLKSFRGEFLDSLEQDLDAGSNGLNEGPRTEVGSAENTETPAESAAV